MKLNVNISFLFKEVPFLERFEKAGEAGFPGVEIGFPYALPAGDIARVRRDTGLGIVVINAPAGDLMEGGEGLAAVPERRPAFKEAVEECLVYAEALGVERVNILPGRCLDPAKREPYLDTLQQNLGYAADKLAGAGVKTVLEALNTRLFPCALIHSTRQMLDVVEAVDHPCLSMEYDIYHMAVMGEDISSDLVKHISRIGHIQFADYPGRGQPGTGKLDIFELLGIIRSTGYGDWVGAEYHPQGSTTESLGWVQDPRLKDLFAVSGLY
jgi:hydroxypyruvate isomerase